MKATAAERFAVFAAGFLMISIGVGHAQIMDQVDFTMSESFTVANTTLPAGQYTIKAVAGTDQTVLEIASANGHHSVMVETNPAQADEAGSHLVFNKYKKVLALSEVFPGGSNHGFQLVQGQPEKLASKTEKPIKESVALSAK